MNLRMGLAALLLAGTACAPTLDADEQVGEKGKLIFSLFECIKCRPVGLRVGSSKVVLTVRRQVEDFPVGHKVVMRGVFGLSSEDPEIIAPSMDLESDPPRFLMRPLTEGSVRLSVLDEAGAVLDSTRVSAFRATRLVMFTDNATRAPSEAVAVAAGVETIVSVRAESAAGELIQGQSWTWWVDDPSIATLWDALPALFEPNATAGRLTDSFSFVYLRGVRSGTTTLHVADAHAEATLTVTVP